jgi:hypothetical protein
VYDSVFSIIMESSRQVAGGASRRRTSTLHLVCFFLPFAPVPHIFVHSSYSLVARSGTPNITNPYRLSRILFSFDTRNQTPLNISPLTHY